MQKIKILTFLLLIALVVSGCNLKVNIMPNVNESEVTVEDNAQEEVTEPEEEIVSEPVDESTDETGELLELSYGDVVFKDFAELCGQPMMMFAEPENEDFVILTPFNLGSDHPVNNLFRFDLISGNCAELEVSKELSDFGARILSPDQKLLALALETDEAKELKLLDLVNDKAMSLLELGEGETLNAGFGAVSNHFDIKWLDNIKIQYTVFEDTIENYEHGENDSLEDMIEVRLLDL